MPGTCEERGRRFDARTGSARLNRPTVRPFSAVLAAVASATLTGAVGRPVSVEVHVSNGLPGFTIVGLPDAAVREARDRVRAAILSSGLPWPLRRVTVNLAPSGVRKGGAGLDLPIAVGLLVAAGELTPGCIEGLSFCGELGLNGSLRHVPGMIALADAAAPLGMVVPLCDVREAALVRGADVRGAATLGDLVAVLRGQAAWPAAPRCRRVPRHSGAARPGRRAGPGPRPTGGGGCRGGAPPPPHGRAARVGQDDAGRAPGGPAPAAHRREALTVTRIHSAAGCALPEGELLQRPPFRAPHHQASIVSLVGGGSWSLRPGEVSLATNGILFLDELGEFPVAALEALRQPLEEGVIRVSRAGGTVTFPAAFLLVAAMNPCPCGEGVYEGACSCSAATRARYRRRISAPLLDRFDLVVPLSRPDPDELLVRRAGRAVRTPWPAAWPPHASRSRDAGGELELAPDAAELLASKLRAGGLSARGLHKVTRVARTVAALAGADVGVLRPRLRGPVAAGRTRRGGGMSADAASDLPPEAFAVALASMPSMGPARLRTLLAADPPAVRLGAGQRRGARRRSATVAPCLASAHRARDPGAPGRAARRIRPAWRTTRRLPRVLFCLGDPAVLSEGRPRRWWGPARRPATASAWPHSSGPTLPRRASAWCRVWRSASTGPRTRAPAAPARRPSPSWRAGSTTSIRGGTSGCGSGLRPPGVIVSESPAGVPTEKWRFPVRNRLLAALSDVVVVVESRHHGGSRHTVDAAMDRGVPVGAVPGSIRSATSEGTNALLADGAFPVCSSGDILRRARPGRSRVTVPPRRRRPPGRPASATAARLRTRVGTAPSTTP